MENSGVKFIAIACNSAHFFLDNIRKKVKVPFISIVEETIKSILNSGKKKPLLLATEFTINNKIFNNKTSEVKFILPSKKHQLEINKIISQVVSGFDKRKLKIDLLKIIGDYTKCDSIVLGCTELPLLIKNKNLFNKKVFSTTEILSKAIFYKSFNN